MSLDNVQQYIQASLAEAFPNAQVANAKAQGEARESLVEELRVSFVGATIPSEQDIAPAIDVTYEIAVTGKRDDYTDTLNLCNNVMIWLRTQDFTPKAPPEGARPGMLRPLELTVEPGEPAAGFVQWIITFTFGAVLSVSEPGEDALKPFLYTGPGLPEFKASLRQLGEVVELFPGLRGSGE